MRRTLLFLAFALAMTPGLVQRATRATAQGETSSAATELVRVSGRELVVGDAPFRFLGANVSVIHGPNERKSYEALLSAVAHDGMSVVRVWALGEQPKPGEPYHPLYAFRIGEDGWLEESFVHLDRVLVAARARGLRVVLVLGNRWKDYGGMSTYVRWSGEPALLDRNGNALGTALSKFYECTACQAQYRAHVERVVGRINSVSGAAYRDDPTILAWELMNEVSAVTARDEDALVRWVEDTARFVRSLDSKHLISAGHIGYGTLRERAVWQRVQALPEIDYADAHAYPLSDPRVSSPSRLARWIEDRVLLARQVIGKPLVFGEIGVDGEASPTPSARARWLDTFVRLAAQAGASGALVWHYDPAANPVRRHRISEDPTDRASYVVRRALARSAAHFAGPPLIRRVSDGERPRFDFRMTTRGERPLQRGFVRQGDALVLDIDPKSLARAEFERAGISEEGPLTMVYGVGAGTMEYRFVAPPVVPSAVRIEARVSSELPGYGVGDDPRDGSDVEIELDGELVGTVRARPDDGLGDVVAVELADTRVLARLFRASRPHVLRLRALPSRYAGGLCVYGKPTGAMALEPAWRRDVSTIRVTLQNAPRDRTAP